MTLALSSEKMPLNPEMLMLLFSKLRQYLITRRKPLFSLLGGFPPFTKAVNQLKVFQSINCLAFYWLIEQMLAGLWQELNGVPLWDA